jgi:hypothetical protein
MSQPRFSTVTARLYVLTLAMSATLSIGGASKAWAQRNTAFGTNALLNNTSGMDDSAFGFQALLSNTMGYFNTASGVNARSGNTIGFKTRPPASTLSATTLWAPTIRRTVSTPCSPTRRARIIQPTASTRSPATPPRPATIPPTVSS